MTKFHHLIDCLYILRYWTICAFQLFVSFKAFIKPFETPRRRVKLKFNLIFSFRPGLRQEGLSYL